MNNKELLPVIDKPPACEKEMDTGASWNDFVQAATSQPWVIGEIDTPAGSLPRVAVNLDRRDLGGSWKARWGIGRMDYLVPPGLYAVGEPDAQSPVLVSANYKLSFDHLRRELSGLDLWIMVLDTKGVNVWCAAGKGNFGTAEIVARIKKVRLPEVVSHRRLILPQLAAPGVSAHEVLRQSGFKVIYGPVRASDIPHFLESGGKTTPEMRRVHFTLRDRLTLTPVELTALLKPAGFLLAALFLINLAGALLGSSTVSIISLVSLTLYGLIPFAGAVLAGAVVAPALLPYIPGRAFAWKGWLMGMLWTVLYLYLVSPGSDWLSAAAYLLLLPAIAAFLTMNFTGSSTYTSLSGVVKEMGVALPAIIALAILGSIALIAAHFI